MGPALPALNRNIEEYVKPSEEMFMEAEEEIAAFDEEFELEAIEEIEGETREKRRIYWKDLIAREEQKLEKKVEEEQVERLKMGKGEDDDKAKKEISSVNPVSDFKAMINDRKVDRVSDAISQMQKMIERFINTSLKGDLFGKAIDCLKELRSACIAEDEAPSFNRFSYRIRNNHSKGDELSNFFLKVINEGVTLITKHESKLSSLVEQ